MSQHFFTYRLDAADVIVGVSDNWSVFADANAWGSAMPPEGVVGRELWEFIHDYQTRQLYEALFQRARNGVPARPIPFRCDSPAERRFLELLIEGLPEAAIGITSRILRTEPRTPVQLLDAGAPRSDELLRICSMCKKIEAVPEQWLEVEDALAELGLFEAEKMPGLTHGVCRSCFDAAMVELDSSTRTDNRGRGGFS